MDVDSLVSMNIWGLTPDFLTTLEGGFREFFEKEVSGNPLKAEYLIPIFIGELLKQGKMSVKVLKTDDTWYGDLLTSDKNVQLLIIPLRRRRQSGILSSSCPARTAVP